MCARSKPPLSGIRDVPPPPWIGWRRTNESRVPERATAGELRIQLSQRTSRPGGRLRTSGSASLKAKCLPPEWQALTIYVPGLELDFDRQLERPAFGVPAVHSSAAADGAGDIAEVA